VPTVITDVGGVPYFEEKYGSFGVRVSLDENDKELAEAITKALAAENKPTVRRAKEVVSSIYNLEEFGRRWTEYLSGVASGKILKNEPFVPSETGVSIITSVYNTNPKYLDEFWSSLQRQTWKHWELILVDDGSSQTATIDKLKEIATDPRVRLILLPENKGASTALNIGLKEARHNLIAIMDSDDVAEPTWLARMIAAIKANPDVDICGCQLTAFDDTTGQTLFITNHPECFDYNLLIQRALNKGLWFVNHGGAIYKRKSILQLGGYDPELRYCYDLELWLRAFESGLTIINIPDVLVRYRKYSDAQLTRHPDLQKTADKLLVGFINKTISKNSVRT
jgi:glycosyltransferase involved in cell wall biosynthesis